MFCFYTCDNDALEYYIHIPQLQYNNNTTAPEFLVFPVLASTSRSLCGFCRELKLELE